MGIAASFKVKSKVPQSVVDELGEFVAFRGKHVFIHEVQIAPLKFIFNVLKRSRIVTPQNSGISLRRDDAPGDFQKSDVVAAVMRPEHIQGAANPQTDYSPHFPGRIPGYVSREKPIVVREKPTGHFAGIGEDVVFSSKLVDFFSDLAVEHDLGKVIWKNDFLPSWHRVFMKTKCRVLDKISFKKEVPSPLNQEPFIPSIGIWIARKDMALNQNIALDSFGFGFRRLKHNFVVKKDWIAEMNQRFSDGLCLEPIFRFESEIAILVSTITSFIQELHEA